MSVILQKIRYWNHSSILHKCTVDDSVAPSEETLQKIAAITWEGPLVSRHIAGALFDKLVKKSSSLSSKIIPVICFVLCHGSVSFKLEVQYKKCLIIKLMESSLTCQGTHVNGLYKELIEIIEHEYKKSLLPDNYDPDHPKCVSYNDFPTCTKGDITRDIQIDDIISPEKRIVDQITAPSCIEPLPPMLEIWQFASQYKQLNQHVVNTELVSVLQQNKPLSQLRALSVVDYLTQHYQSSCKVTFLHAIQDISNSENMDLQKKAKKILNRLSSSDPSTQDGLPSPPVSPHLATQTHSSSQNNLYSSHMKRSYDKILPTSGYRTMPNSSTEHTDEALLDLGSPCSSTSYNTSPPPCRTSSAGFLSFFREARPPSRPARRDSSGSTDNLLEGTALLEGTR